MKTQDITSSGLSEADIEHYYRDGYAVIDRPMYTVQELSEVERLMAGLRSNLLELPDQFVVDLAKGKGPAQIDEVLWPSRLEPRLKRTKVFLRTKQIAEVLLDGPVTLHFDHHIEKSPHSDRGTPWHQDQGFERDIGAKATFWIPTVDVNEDNGCMWYVPGTHNLGIVHHDRVGISGVVIPDVDESKAVSAPLRKGGFAVHNELSFHASKPNTTDGSRPAWILRFKRDDHAKVRLAITEMRKGTSAVPGLNRLNRVKHK